MRDRSGSAFVLVLAVLLMLGGGLLAYAVQTDYGAVSVAVVRFAADDGRIVHGHLHRPSTATASSPAPGVLAVHGVPGTLETQANYALELARRGYVVLTIDQRGYGRSQPPAGAGGSGAVDALAFLRTLSIVDQEQIVLVGHSTGGAGVLIAAAVEPDAYAAMVLSGAAPGAFGAPEGSSDFPRNLAVVSGQFDELAPMLWGTDVAARAGAGSRMRALFGSDEPVREGLLHGSLEEGTARIWYAPGTTNPGLYLSGAAIAPVIDWVQRTTIAPLPLPAGDQVWMLREAGSGAVLLGFLLALFGFSGALLGGPTFGRLRYRLAPAAGLTGLAWWLAASSAAAVPALTYFWAQNLSTELLTESWALPQPGTTGTLGWMLLSAAFALVVVLIWYLLAGRAREARSDTLGLATGGLLRALLFALTVVGGAHALLALVGTLYGVGARAYLVTQAPLTGAQLAIGAVYLLPFVLAFALLGMLLHAVLRPVEAGAEGADAMIANALVASGGVLVLLIAQYVPLLGGQALPFGEPLLTLRAIELVVVLAAAAMLSTYLFARTGSVWPGAMVNGVWVTAYLVGSQATTFPL